MVREMSAKQIDQALVDRVRAGDRSAFDLLVRKYQHKVMSLISRYVYDPDEAADVAQETFIKAYSALNGFRGESAFYTWLYRIAVNTAKNHLVSRGRRPPKQDIDACEAEQYEGAGALKEFATPEGQMLTEEIAAAVKEAMEVLSPDLRMAISLREFEGLSYEEIAEVMDCPIGTVRSRIFRAREVMDEKLRPLLP